VYCVELRAGRLDVEIANDDAITFSELGFGNGRLYASGGQAAVVGLCGLGPNGAVFRKAAVSGLAFNRLDIHPVKRLDQIAKHAFGIEAVVRSEALSETRSPAS
jgi:hypothetical protein